MPPFINIVCCSCHNAEQSRPWTGRKALAKMPSGRQQSVRSSGTTSLSIWGQQCLHCLVRPRPPPMISCYHDKYRHQGRGMHEICMGKKLLLHSLQSTTTRRKTDPKPRRNYKQKYAYHKEVRKIGLDHVKASKKRWMREVWGDTVYIISTICHSNTKIGGC